MMKARKVLVGAVAMAGAAMLSTNAMALNSVMSDLVVGANDFEDNHRAYLSLDVDGDRHLDVDDVFRFIATYNGVNAGGGVNHGAGTAGRELTAIGEILVLSKTINNDDGDGIFEGLDSGGQDGDPNTADNETLTYVFGPNPTFTLPDGTIIGSAGGDTPGAMVVFFEDGSNNADFHDGDFSAGAIAAAELTFTDGKRLGTLGFDADPDVFWVITDAATDDIDFLAAQLASFQLGLANFGLNYLDNAVAETWDGIKFGEVFNVGTHFAGNTTVLGTFDANGVKISPFDELSDTDVVFVIKSLGIPEPVTATMGMMGLGALSMVARRRRMA